MESSIACCIYLETLENMTSPKIACVQAMPIEKKIQNMYGEMEYIYIYVCVCVRKENLATAHWLRY
jgi:hypothetical protein